jgi:hypothetical protein
LDYGRSTIFTVSLKGIIEIAAAGIHEVRTIIRLSRSRRAAWFRDGLLAQMLTAAPSRIAISKTTPC